MAPRGMRGSKVASKMFGLPPLYEFGVDEAGRGPLAGPVVCAACYLPPGTSVEGVMDSKQISTEEAREEVYARLITTQGVLWQVVKAEPMLIDDINILQATLAAMRLASLGLCSQLLANQACTEVLDCRALKQYHDITFPETKSTFRVLVDGNKDPFQGHTTNLSLESRAIIGGDASILSISAASVIAKVTRDRIMNQLHEKHPEYNFMSHKGYGTSSHRALISKHGWIQGIHRTSFNPVKSMIANDIGPRSHLALQLVPKVSQDEASEQRLHPPNTSQPATTQQYQANDEIRAPLFNLDDLEQLTVLDMRSKLKALGLDAVVKRDQGPKGPGRIKAVLLERLRAYAILNAPPVVSSSSAAAAASSDEDDSRQPPKSTKVHQSRSQSHRSSKRLRNSNSTDVSTAVSAIC